MEVLFYSLGILTVAFIYAVVNVFKLKQRVDFLEIDKDQLHNLRQIEIKDLSRQFNEEMNALYREMDTRINDHAVQPLKETNEGIAREIEDIYRMVDSRLDKLENKLTNS